MIPTIIKSLKPHFDISKIKAHCDIPCKIYDPAIALIGALSVVRIIDIMGETSNNSDLSSFEKNNILARCIQRKEDEAEKVKHEVRIIWGDFFKAPQLESHPDAHDITHQIMVTASACKQGAKRVDAEELLNNVNLFAEIFWESKNINSERKICPYPPELPIVYPVL